MTKGYAERQTNGDIALIIDVRAYDPDGSLEFGDLVAYGPGCPGPPLGPLFYDGFWRRWRSVSWVDEQSASSGTYTVRVTDADGKFSGFREVLDFNPLPSVPEILYPKDTTITTVVPKLEWTMPQGAIRCGVGIRNASNQIIFSRGITGST